MILVQPRRVRWTLWAAAILLAVATHSVLAQDSEDDPGLNQSAYKDTPFQW
jgi:hypothetical protein